ncbi:hypothetical protein [Streptomyces sp. NBC_01423]|uniref:hypothetical protein n=1 Tax=Streptomyces sp. NBC_01423 TaxID=2903860 RepID=UPI002E2D7E85|nr:hypothetical protein [Streptomyces sp. NBC_01423]
MAIKRVLVLAVIFAASVSVSQSAVASDNMYKTANANWSCPDGSFGSGFCQTDNSTLTYYEQGSVNGAVGATVDLTMFDSYDGTDLNVTWIASPSYSGGAETDIIYQVSTSGFSGNTIGQTWCDDATTATKCDQEYVRFRAASYVDRELACHETGHAVGLTHGADAYPSESNTASELGCMETPDTGNNPYIESHNVSEINATY